MVVPNDEVSLAVREWYYAASEGQIEKFLNFFVQDERTVYFGSDPHELWYGYSQIKDNIEANFRTYGKWTIMSKNLSVHKLGSDFAVFADDVELSAHLENTGIAEEARVTGALILQNGEWKIIQAHVSFGISNQELLPG